MRQPGEVRAAVLAALAEIAMNDGLEEVSFRDVAARAGVSVGAVQYHFGTKDDLLEQAFTALTDGFLGQIEEIATTPGDPLDALHEVLALLLPLDEESVAAARLWLTFAARAAVTPRLAQVQARAQAQARAAIAEALQRGQRAGSVDPGVHCAEAAVTVAALVDGLTVHSALDPAGTPPELAAAVLAGYITRLRAR